MENKLDKQVLKQKVVSAFKHEHPYIDTVNIDIDAHYDIRRDTYTVYLNQIVAGFTLTVIDDKYSLYDSLIYCKLKHNNDIIKQNISTNMMSFERALDIMSMAFRQWIDANIKRRHE